MKSKKVRPVNPPKLLQGVHRHQLPAISPGDHWFSIGATASVVDGNDQPVCVCGDPFRHPSELDQLNSEVIAELPVLLEAAVYLWSHLSRGDVADVNGIRDRLQSALVRAHVQMPGMRAGMSVFEWEQAVAEVTSACHIAKGGAK
jgi:hypothetical protein